MSDYWKLDIDDYTTNELNNLFNLKSPYTLEHIVNADNDLTEKITVDGSIDENKKIQILRFLSKAREKLIQSHKKEIAHLVKTQIHVGDGHMVQKRQLENNFIRGTSVPLDTKGLPKSVYKKVIAINSKFRDDYYGTLGTDYLTTLPTKIKKVISMELVGFEIPNTYFQISKSLQNNFFWLGWQKEEVLDWYYISIPDGTYTRETMQNMVNSQIQKATGKDSTECPQCSIDIHSLRTIFALPITTSNISAFLQLAFNRTRGPALDASGASKTYTVTDVSQNNINPADIDINNTNIAQNFGWILGFRMAEYKASTAYVSEGVYDSWGTKYIYVGINDYNKNFTNLVEPIYNSSLGRDNILARIPLAPLLSSIARGTSLADQFNPGHHVRHYFGPVDIEKIHLTVTDEFGRVINLNNMDLSLSLKFVCLYG
uniref:Uncharacterized protein n=1 Tax=viral metagenome TaxID=1070528 RepID=A0A6C0C6V5_9ZZZZ